jgi:hypothetical protein
MDKHCNTILSYRIAMSLRDEPKARTANPAPADPTGRVRYPRAHPSAAGRHRTRTLLCLPPLILLNALLLIALLLISAAAGHITLGTGPTEVRELIAAALKLPTAAPGSDDLAAVVVSSLLKFNGQTSNEQVDNNNMHHFLFDLAVMEVSGRAAFPREAVESIEIAKQGDDFSSDPKRGTRILSQTSGAFGVGYKYTSVIGADLSPSLRENIADSIYDCVRRGVSTDLFMKLVSRMIAGHDGGSTDPDEGSDDFITELLANQAGGTTTGTLDYDSKKAPYEPAPFDDPKMLETELSITQFVNTANASASHLALPDYVTRQVVDAAVERHAGNDDDTSARDTLNHTITFGRSFNDLENDPMYADSGIDWTTTLPPGVTDAEKNARHLPPRAGSRSTSPSRDGSQPIVKDVQERLSNFHMDQLEKHLEQQTARDDAQARILVDACNHARNCQTLGRSYTDAKEAARAHKDRADHFLAGTTALRATIEQQNIQLEDYQRQDYQRWGQGRTGRSGPRRDQHDKVSVNMVEKIGRVEAGFREWRRETNDALYTGDGAPRFDVGPLSIGVLSTELQIALINVYGQLCRLDHEIKRVMPVEPNLLAAINSQFKTVAISSKRGPLEVALGYVPTPLFFLVAITRALAPSAKPVSETSLRSELVNVPSADANNIPNLTALVTQLQKYVTDCKRYRTAPNVHAVLTIVQEAFVSANYVSWTCMTDLKLVITSTSMTLNTNQDTSDAVYGGHNGLTLMQGMIDALVKESDANFAYRQAQSTAASPSSQGLGVNLTSSGAPTSAPSMGATAALHAPSGGGGGGRSRGRGAGGGGGGGSGSKRSGRKIGLSVPLPPNGAADFGAYPNPDASPRMSSLICSGVVRYGYEVGADVVCCINLGGDGCNYGGHPVNTDSRFLADNPTALQQFWSHMVSSQNGYELDPTAARRLGIHYNALSPAFKSCNPDLPTIGGEAKIQPTAAELAEVGNNANGRGRSRSRGRARDRAPPSGVSFQTAPSAAAAVAPVLAPAVVNAVASPMTAPQNAVPVPVSEPDAFAGQATEILMCELGGVLETKFTPTRAAECMGKIEAGLVKDPVAQRACVIAMLRRFES